MDEATTVAPEATFVVSEAHWGNASVASFSDPACDAEPRAVVEVEISPSGELAGGAAAAAGAAAGAAGMSSGGKKAPVELRCAAGGGPVRYHGLAALLGLEGAPGLARFDLAYVPLDYTLASGAAVGGLGAAFGATYITYLLSA